MDSGFHAASLKTQSPYVLAGLAVLNPHHLLNRLSHHQPRHCMVPPNLLTHTAILMVLEVTWRGGPQTSPSSRTVSKDSYHHLGGFVTSMGQIPSIYGWTNATASFSPSHPGHARDHHHHRLARDLAPERQIVRPSSCLRMCHWSA
jgi:hypothetical protein